MFNIYSVAQINKDNMFHVRINTRNGYLKMSMLCETHLSFDIESCIVHFIDRFSLIKKNVVVIFLNKLRVPVWLSNPKFPQMVGSQT